MTPEKIVQTAILKYLKKLSETQPLFFERRQVGGLSYKKGIADIYAVYDGLHIEIEVKKPGGHQSAMQEKFEEKCKKIGIPYLCVDSVDQVVAFFESLNVNKL